MPGLDRLPDRQINTPQRYAKRVQLESPVTLSTSGGDVKGRMVNVSTGGMAVLTGLGSSLGRFVRLYTKLGDSGPRFDLDAIVLHRTRKSNGILWGLQFHQTSPHILAQIEAFVQQHGEDDDTDLCNSADEPPVAPPSIPQNEKLSDLFNAALRELEA